MLCRRCWSLVLLFGHIITVWWGGFSFSISFLLRRRRFDSTSAEDDEQNIWNFHLFSHLKFLSTKIHWSIGSREMTATLQKTHYTYTIYICICRTFGKNSRRKSIHTSAHLVCHTRQRFMKLIRNCTLHMTWALGTMVEERPRTIVSAFCIDSNEITLHRSVGDFVVIR